MTSAGLMQVFMTLRPALTRFFAARGARPDEAEDLAQDLFLRIEEQTIGPVAEPRAYLYRMADNLMLNRRRSASRRIRRETEWSGRPGGIDVEADDRPSAEAVLAARERLAHVDRVLDALPERTAVCFRRFRIEGEAQKAIAADLGISVSAVEKHLQRAYRAVLEIRLRLDADSGVARHLRVESEDDVA
ncbi:MAG: RNA polymerase sigma factor [Janthinobacterium lividum]